MHDDGAQGRKADPAGYDQIYQTQHFFRENDKAEPDQTGPKRWEKLPKNVPVEKSNQRTGRKK